MPSYRATLRVETDRNLAKIKHDISVSLRMKEKICQLQAAQKIKVIFLVVFHESVNIFFFQTISRNEVDSIQDKIGGQWNLSIATPYYDHQKLMKQYMVA